MGSLQSAKPCQFVSTPRWRHSTDVWSANAGEHCGSRRVEPDGQRSENDAVLAQVQLLARVRQDRTRREFWAAGNTLRPVSSAPAPLGLALFCASMPSVHEHRGRNIRLRPSALLALPYESRCRCASTWYAGVAGAATWPRSAMAFPTRP